MPGLIDHIIELLVTFSELLCSLVGPLTAFWNESVGAEVPYDQDLLQQDISSGDVPEIKQPLECLDSDINAKDEFGFTILDMTSEEVEIVMRMRDFVRSLDEDVTELVGDILASPVIPASGEESMDNIEMISFVNGIFS